MWHPSIATGSSRVRRQAKQSSPRFSRAECPRTTHGPSNARYASEPVDWIRRDDGKPKYVVSSTRKDFPWTNSHHIAGDLREGVQELKDATPTGVLLGSGKLATELDRLDLIDEYKLRGKTSTFRKWRKKRRAWASRPSQDRRPRPDAVSERAARHASARAALGEAAPQRRGGHALPPRALNHRSPIAASSPASAASASRSPRCTKAMFGVIAPRMTRPARAAQLGGDGEGREDAGGLSARRVQSKPYQASRNAPTS